MPKPSKPVTIRGVNYPSISSAAEAVGVTHNAVTDAMRGGRLETVGLNPRGKNYGRRVVIDGKAYPSIYAAAREIGVDWHKVKAWVGDE